MKRVNNIWGDNIELIKDSNNVKNQYQHEFKSPVQSSIGTEQSKEEYHPDINIGPEYRHCNRIQMEIDEIRRNANDSYWNGVCYVGGGLTRDQRVRIEELENDLWREEFRFHMDCERERARRY